MNRNLSTIMSDGPMIPVVTIRDDKDAVSLARAFVAGGIRVIEVTLRTAAALEAIERIAAEVPNAIVGAGTVLTGDQARLAEKAGAHFLVSPGMTDRLWSEVHDLSIPLLSGVASPSEAMRAVERGATRLKFFPAEPAGGTAMLKAFYGPLADLVFCPTGGIDLSRAPAYLACPNVACIGGSWLTPSQAIQEGAWSAITDAARRALDALSRPVPP